MLRRRQQGVVRVFLSSWGAHRPTATVKVSAIPLCRDVTCSGDDDAAAAAAAVSHTLPPRRRVARWYFPGFTQDETNKEHFAASPHPSAKHTNAATKGRDTGLLSPLSASSSSAAANGGEEEAADGHHPLLETAATAGGNPSVMQSTKTSLDDRLPSAYSDYLNSRNKRLKAILMNALGTDFAKAGANNDGVRRSFSVAASEAATRVIGLRRVPHKLLISCIAGSSNDWNWVDIASHPTAAIDEYRDALSQVLLDLGTHEALVSDAVEPMLLPQTTVIHGCHCIVVRYAVDVASTSVDSFQDLTNRFTILVTDTRVITIHRMYCSFVENVKCNWPQLAVQQGENGKVYLLGLLIKELVETFNTALARSLLEFDEYEANLFSLETRRSTLARKIYHVKRRASVYARTLNLMGDAYTHLCSTLLIAPTDVQFQEVQQDIAHVKSLSEELNSNTESALQLLFQLSSYQLNELMRVLTMFSALFIPLSFIASIYGMNFTHLPLLQHAYGHLYCMILMLFIGGGLGAWFRWKRFW